MFHFSYCFIFIFCRGGQTFLSIIVVRKFLIYWGLQRKNTLDQMHYRWHYKKKMSSRTPSKLGAFSSATHICTFISFNRRTSVTKWGKDYCSKILVFNIPEKWDKPVNSSSTYDTWSTEKNHRSNTHTAYKQISSVLKCLPVKFY